MLRLRLLTLVALGGLAAAQKEKSPAPPPAPPDQAAIDAAIDRGTAYLLQSYVDKLTKDNLGGLERTGQVALSLYTLLKSGVPKDDATVRELVAHLLAQRAQHTYDTACTLLALAAHDVIDDRRWIDELARQLIAWQTKDGDWAYPEGGNDLSNTQYAALGLWAASKAGVPIETRVWERLASATQRYQGQDGGFSYSPDGRGSTGSMTAAGIAVLAICEVELRRAGRWNAALDDALGKSRKRGADWLATNFAVNTNPRSGGWLYYYLYGLERLGAFTGIAQLGAHDWYAEGAGFLVPQQGEEGAWQNGTDPSETCFALLFLRRATLAQELERRGPVTGVAPKVGDDDAPLKLTSQGQGPVRIWIDAWNKKLVQSLEWPDERGRGLRVARVEYLEGERVIAVELGDGTRASRGARFGIEHVFSGFGVHRVRARALVRGPAGDRTLESPEIEITPERAWPDWIAELGNDFGPNLIEPDRAKVHATSVAKPKSAPLGLTFGADQAIDGRALRPWLADAEDDKRTLTISLAKSVEAQRIRITPATFAPLGAEALSRVLEVEIEVNGKDARRLALDPDPRRPMTLVLERRTPVKRIDVRIVEIVINERCPLVGIGEVELFAGK
jgi:hypothetical protein